MAASTLEEEMISSLYRVDLEVAVSEHDMEAAKKAVDNLNSIEVSSAEVSELRNLMTHLLFSPDMEGQAILRYATNNLICMEPYREYHNNLLDVSEITVNGDKEKAEEYLLAHKDPDMFANGFQDMIYARGCFDLCRICGRYDLMKEMRGYLDRVVSQYADKI